MKRKIIVLISFFVLSIPFAQTKPDNKLKIHSVGIGFGGFYLKDSTISEEGGLGFLADVTFSVNKNLISTSLLYGAEIGIISPSGFNFHEISLKYGRQLKIKNWLSLEGFLGVGTYSQQSNSYYINDGNSISFPIQINTKFYFNKRFGIGLNSNYSINQINNNLTMNLLFHFKFKKL